MAENDPMDHYHNTITKVKGFFTDKYKRELDQKLMSHLASYMDKHAKDGKVNLNDEKNKRNCKKHKRNFQGFVSKT